MAGVPLRCRRPGFGTGGSHAHGVALKTLALCVDDVGLLAGGAATVIALASAGRICAASCMTTGPHWRGEAAALTRSRDVLGRLELGLHVNLTEGAPLSADLGRHRPTLPRLPALIVAAHLGRLPLEAVAVELRAQLDAFVDAVGRLPAFVDGHQHVHHLPGVRERVLKLVAGDGAQRPSMAVRNTGRVLGPGRAVKRLLIARTGGTALQKLLERRAVRHNAVLLGVYDFTPHYRGLMRGWLRAAPAAGGLIFCHPRAGTPVCGDSIAAARFHEAAYLASTAFADDLAEVGVTVGPAWS